MKVERLQGTELKNLFQAANRLLTAKQDEVDALNVFPVPDGDTGTNMALTFQAAVSGMEQAAADSASKVAEAAAQGSLMGARGNSGVILSQLLRGFALGLAGKTDLGPKDLAQALQSGVDTAYLGVKKPVEGTILTVARLAAKGAVQAAKTGSGVVGVLEAAYAAAQQALVDTPKLLPVLKQVGVVDAGGMGWLLVLQGFLQAAKGETLAEELPGGKASLTMETVDRPSPDLPIAGDLPVSVEQIEFQYCTELILKGAALNQDGLSSELEPWGDSLLVVGDPSMLKVHIHSNHPGRVLEICLNQGSLHEVHINNMVEQFQSKQPHSKPLGLVAVASGAGLKNILFSLGVDQVIEGGQTSNPSAEDLIKAIEAVNAGRVILLPNNSNIILAAQQARELVNKPVEIIPAKSIPQGIAALVAFDPYSTPETNLERMVSAAAQVVSVEITYAVRDSQWEGREIKAGDILGLVEDRITVVGQQINPVVEQVLDRVLTPAQELVTLFYGGGIGARQAHDLQVELSEKYPDVDFELQEGGQPLYYYIISVG